MSAKRKSISSDLKRLDKITDSNIDYSDIPPLDESFFKKEIVTLNAVLKVYTHAKQKHLKDKHK